MTAVYLHLLINHVPILGTAFCLLLLLGAAVRKSHELTQAGMLGLVLVGLVAVPTYFSGEKAEETVKPLPEVSNVIMEEHEAAALSAVLTASGVGLLSLAGLVLYRGPRAMPRWLPVVVLVGSAVSLALMVRTGSLGGQVRHSEIRGGAPAHRPPPAPAR